MSHPVLNELNCRSYVLHHCTTGRTVTACCASRTSVPSSLTVGIALSTRQGRYIAIYRTGGTEKKVICKEAAFRKHGNVRGLKSTYFYRRRNEGGGGQRGKGGKLSPQVFSS